MASVFGDPRQWSTNDLIALSPEFDAQLTVAAYREGVFPMPIGQSIGWWSPIARGILPLAGLRVPRSLRQAAKRYTTTIDTAFATVLDRCADPTRKYGWITDDVRRVFTELFDRGLAHSVETWDASGRLVGGLYGLSLGGLFAGESMFHDRSHGRDASKVALLRLVAALTDEHAEQRLIDVQWRTDHLASLGVVEVHRDYYLDLLAQALTVPEPSWDARREESHA